MMTPKEIKEATSMLKWHTLVSHKTMAKALSSLAEAYAEIERLRHETRDCIVCKTRIEPNNGVCFGCHTVYKALGESTTL